MANVNGKGGFGENRGNINRKGRPKSFDALRALAQQVSHETITRPDGSTLTAVEAVLRNLMADNPERFLEIAYGKVPQPVDVDHSGSVTVKVKGYANFSPDDWDKDTA